MCDGNPPLQQEGAFILGGAAVTSDVSVAAAPPAQSLTAASGPGPTGPPPHDTQLPRAASVAPVPQSMPSVAYCGIGPDRCARCERLRRSWESLPVATHPFDLLLAHETLVARGCVAHQACTMPDDWPRVHHPDCVPMPTLPEGGEHELQLMRSEVSDILARDDYCSREGPLLGMARAAALASGGAFTADDTGLHLPWRTDARPDAFVVTDLDNLSPPLAAELLAHLHRQVARDVLEFTDDVAATSLVFLSLSGPKPRFCADQSWYRPFLAPATCVYETAERALTHPATTAFGSLDVWGAFPRIVVSSRDRRFLGLELRFRGRSLRGRFRRLPLGLPSAPPAWESAAGLVTSIARGSSSVVPDFAAVREPLLPPTLRNWRALPVISTDSRYVDDHAVPDHGLPVAMIRYLRRLIAVYFIFGVPPAADKLSPWPCTSRLHTGLVLDAVRRTLRVAPSKAARFAVKAAHAVECVRRAAAALPFARRSPLAAALLHVVRSVAGDLAFFSMAAREINLFRGPLDDFVVEFDVAEAGMAGSERGGPRRQRVIAARAQADVPRGEINPEALEALRAALEWWRQQAPSLPTWSRRRYPAPAAPLVRLLSDSSGSAWGVVVFLRLSHFLLVEPLTVWQSQMSSGYRELLPPVRVLRHLRAHGHLADGAHVAWWVDASVAVAYGTRWKSPDPRVLLLLTELLGLLREWDLTWGVTRVSRAHSWVPVADLLSKAVWAPSPEYSLPQDTFSALVRQTGARPQCDLFATTASAQLPAYCALSLRGVTPAAVAALGAALVAAGTAALAPDGVHGELLPQALPPSAPDIGWLGGAYDICWEGRRLYAFPPFSQVQRTLAYWASIRPGAASELLLVTREDLLPVSNHPDEVARAPVRGNLILPSGGVAPRPPPWPLIAVLLRR